MMGWNEVADHRPSNIRGNPSQPEEMAGRLARIREEMTGLGLDAMVSTDAANIRYATGFRGEPRTLLITAEEVILYTSFRTLPWAEKQTEALGSNIELSTSPKLIDDIRRRLPTSSVNLGVDRTIAHREFLSRQADFAPHILQAAAPIERVRQIKSPAEIALLTQSQHINEAILNAVIPQLRPGMSERAVQGLILAAMAANVDVDQYSFMPIVAVGANAWEIHHLPDRTLIERDQMLLLDLGIVYQGYASDMTRTVCLGKANQQMREVYDSVCKAQQSAIAAMRPGASTHDVDRIARDIISEAGHGRSYTHGLGHSIGLETHDPGLNLSTKSPDTELEAGMVFTVEPGIYIESEFGVRIEDVVVITEDGAANITKQSSALLEISV
jgi:Xaa-Pro aminopeptidase